MSEPLRNLNWAYFSRQGQTAKNTKADKPRNEHTLGESTKEQSNLVGTSQKSEMNMFLETLQKKQKYQHPAAKTWATPRESPITTKSQRFRAIGSVSRSGLSFLGCFGTVLRNVLISWPMAFGTFKLLFFWNGFEKRPEVANGMLSHDHSPCCARYSSTCLVGESYQSMWFPNKSASCFFWVSQHLKSEPS